MLLPHTESIESISSGESPDEKSAAYTEFYESLDPRACLQNIVDQYEQTNNLHGEEGEPEPWDFSIGFTRDAEKLSPEETKKREDDYKAACADYDAKMRLVASAEAIADGSEDITLANVEGAQSIVNEAVTQAKQKLLAVKAEVTSGEKGREALLAVMAKATVQEQQALMALSQIQEVVGNTFPGILHKKYNESFRHFLECYRAQRFLEELGTNLSRPDNL
jgi:hypothetical protein